MPSTKILPDPCVTISPTQADFTFYSSEMVAIVDTVDFEFTQKGNLTRNTLRLLDHVIRYLSEAGSGKMPSMHSIGVLIELVRLQATANRGDRDDPGSAEDAVIFWNYRTTTKASTGLF